MTLKKYIEENKTGTLYIGTEKGGGWLYVGRAQNALERLEELRLVYILDKAKKALTKLDKEESGIVRKKMDTSASIRQRLDSYLSIRADVVNEILELGHYQPFDNRQVLSITRNLLDEDGQPSEKPSGYKIVIEGDEPCKFWTKAEYNNATSNGKKLYIFSRNKEMEELDAEYGEDC